MKIALLGNMNNNNFSIMRYFRDLGADAHLLRWRDDEIGSNSHFIPENDTWNLDKWKPYVHKLPIDGSYYSLIGNPKKLRVPPTKKFLKKHLSGYDAYIGSGLTPSILNRCGMSLDIFYPYGVGIEEVGDRLIRLLLKDGPIIKRSVFAYIRKKQIIGIRSARFCINLDMGLTRQTFEELGIDFIRSATPIVYNREAMEDSVPIESVDDAKKFDESTFKILSQSRHFWLWDKLFSKEEWEKRSKHKEWLIHGFSNFLKEVKDDRSILIFMDYGKDVDASKKLCSELGIEQNIMWLPQMPRKNIMQLLKNCDIGVDQFSKEPGALWGGTGWEALASGKPLLNSLGFTHEEYHKTFGHEPPPILDVKSPEDIAAHLIDMYRNRDKMRVIGEKSGEWFNKYNGIGLAKKWLELLSS